MASNISDKRGKLFILHIVLLIFVPRVDPGEPENVYYLTLVNECPSHSVNVSVGVYATQCKFYNVSEDQWETTGCVPAPESVTSHTICYCNHLTLFGASVLVSPALLNFQKIVVSG